MRKMSDAEILKHKENPNILLKVGGKSFRCDCGCNVFHHIDDWDEYYCNSCGTGYESICCKESYADLPEAKRVTNERSTYAQLCEGWRDASKELPEIEGEYLCISKWITNDLGQIFYKIFYFDGKKWLTDNIYDQRFVAWRPLPDPPDFL